MDTISLLYQKYEKEMENIKCCEVMGEEAFRRYVFPLLNKLECIIIEDLPSAGILYYECREKDGLYHCQVPLFGYYFQDEKMAFNLFQKLLEVVPAECSCVFYVNLYSKDQMAIHVFSMMQFHMSAEKRIRKLENEDMQQSTRISVRVLPKNEIEERWDEIWELTNHIVDPGLELAEAAFWDFYSDEGLELIAAFHNDLMVGLIEWNKNGNELACGDNSVNVGGLYVEPEYWNTGLASQLLQFAENRAINEGFGYMWIENVSTNAMTVGFWNQYFSPFQYELIRNV